MTASTHEREAKGASASELKGAAKVSYRSHVGSVAFGRGRQASILDYSTPGTPQTPAPPAEQIRRMGVSTLEDLVNYVLGFQVTSDAIFGRMPRLSVRGVFSSVSSGILLLRDGVPMWNPYDGSAWSFERHVMLHDVE